MPGGSAATAAAERLLDGLRGADQYRKAALEYAHAPFTKAKSGEEAKSHSGDEGSIIPSLQELWHLIWKEEEKEASERRGRKPRTVSWAAKAGGIALLVTSASPAV